MKTIKFLEDLVETLGMHISSDGYIFIDNEKTVKLTGKNKKPVVIPTPENIATLLDTRTGKINKYPFNPLIEDVIKADSVSTNKVLKATKARFGLLTQELGKFLLSVAADHKLEKLADFNVMDFIAKLSEAKIGNTAKNIVDDQTIAAWTKMCDNSIISGNLEIVKVFATKRGKIDDKSFNRVVTVHSPLLDALTAKDIKPKDTINGVKLKNRVTINALVILLRYLLKELNEDNVLIVGSNDGTRPCFIATMQIYLVMMEHFNKLCKGVEKIDPTRSDMLKTVLTVSLEDLNKLDQYNSELKVIPSEKDMMSAGIESVKDVKNEYDSVLTKLTNQNYNGGSNVVPAKQVTSPASGNAPTTLELMLGKRTAPAEEAHTHSMTTDKLYAKTDNTYVPGSFSGRASGYTQNQMVFGSTAPASMGYGGGYRQQQPEQRGYNFSGIKPKYKF